MGYPPGSTVRRPPIDRTILAWTCILSLAASGCAANRSSVPAERSAPEAIRVLAVIPANGEFEINVVRTGNSRILGALRGAGRGFVEGAAGIARGAGNMGACSGEGCAAIAVVMVALMVSAGTVGAVIGGVKGSRVPAPYQQVTDPDDATRNRVASLRIQEGIAGLVEEEAARRLSIPVPHNALPPGKSGPPEEILRELKATGVDAALRVGITRVGFEGPVGKDPPTAVVIALRAEIVRTSDGRRIYGSTIEHRSVAMPGEYWVDNDFHGLTREMEDGVRDLAKRCVDGILESDLVPGPPR